jgi:hypothetical protein
VLRFTTFFFIQMPSREPNLLSYTLVDIFSALPANISACATCSLSSAARVFVPFPPIIHYYFLQFDSPFSIFFDNNLMRYADTLDGALSLFTIKGTLYSSGITGLSWCCIFMDAAIFGWRLLSPWCRLMNFRQVSICQRNSNETSGVDYCDFINRCIVFMTCFAGDWASFYSEAQNSAGAFCVTHVFVARSSTMTHSSGRHF